MEKDEITVGKLKELDTSDTLKLKVHGHIIGVPKVVPSVWGDITCYGTDTEFAVISGLTGRTCLAPGTYEIRGTVRLDGNMGFILQEDIEYGDYQLLLLDRGPNKRLPITIVSK